MSHMTTSAPQAFGRPDLSRTAAANDGWAGLYRLGGASALAAALITAVSIVAFIVWPPPDGTAADWFALFNDNPLRGLVSLDLPFLVVNVLMVPLMLALYMALHRVNPAAMLIAIAVYAVSLAGVFASNPMVEMLSLSRQYTAATGAQQTALLGAGEALLASYEGTAFHAFYILGQLAGIVIGVVMLRSAAFGRLIAYLMIVGNFVGFGLYLPTIGLTLSVLSGLVLWVWMILLGRRLLQAGATRLTSGSVAAS